MCCCVSEIDERLRSVERLLLLGRKVRVGTYTHPTGDYHTVNYLGEVGVVREVARDRDSGDTVLQVRMDNGVILTCKTNWVMLETNE